MKIPKYVQELMSRSHYEFSRCTNNPNYSAGYTISIEKYSDYQQAYTLNDEVERLCKWANRVLGVECAYILYVPTDTHYCRQAAIVSIFDPVMKHIEQYIPEYAK